jgi:hypothetical protein
MKFVLLIVPWCLLAGCVTQKRLDKRYDELVTAYRAEAGLPSKPPPETPVDIQARLKAEARAQVEAEVEEERKKALEKGTEAAGKFAAGDWIGGILALVGLGGIALGARKAAA